MKILKKKLGQIIVQRILYIYLFPLTLFYFVHHYFWERTFCYKTKELSKLNSPWSSPFNHPASLTRYPYFSTGLTKGSRYRSFLLLLTLTPLYISLIPQT